MVKVLEDTLFQICSMKLLCCWRGGEGEEGSPRATEALREEQMELR